MTDWEMLVEQFPGRHNFPRDHAEAEREEGRSELQVHDDGPAASSRATAGSSTTTTRCRGTSSATISNVSVFKGLDTYRGTAQFSNGSVKIQSYDRFRADMQTRFKIDGGKIVLEDINLQSTGADTHVTGYVDFKNWPEMLYNVKSKIDFPIQKAIYLQDDELRRHRPRRFRRHVPFFKTPRGTGRELKGTFTSPEAGVNAWRFPDVRGSLVWNNSAFRVTDVTTALSWRPREVRLPDGAARPAGPARLR